MNKRKCAICKKEFQKTRPLQMVCSVTCGYKYSNKIKEKKKKDWPKRKKAMKEHIKTLSEWYGDLQKVVNEFIRLRDHKLPCISCGITYGQFQAGHYFNVGQYPSVRFHEDNIHKQCAQCNEKKGGFKTAYYPNLIKKIGQEKFDELERLANQSQLKLQVYEVKDMKTEYKKKIKELKDELNI